MLPHCSPFLLNRRLIFWGPTWTRPFSCLQHLISSALVLVKMWNMTLTEVFLMFLSSHDPAKDNHSSDIYHHSSIVPISKPHLHTIMPSTLLSVASGSYSSIFLQDPPMLLYVAMMCSFPWVWYSTAWKQHNLILCPTVHGDLWVSPKLLAAANSSAENTQVCVLWWTDGSISVDYKSRGGIARS